MEKLAIIFIVLAVLVIAFIVFGIAISISESRHAARQREARRSSVDQLVNQHKEALARQRMTLVSKDPYGVADTKKWDKEIRRFAESVVMPVIHPAAKKVDPVLLQLVAATVNEIVLPHAEGLAASLDFDPTMSPVLFERWCAKKLGDAGWEARVTVASGDQGADVIVQKGDVHGVIQCKLYSKPVGNKAVQEAHSAKSHYKARFAAVVSNASYTPSARALASSTGVHLLHVSDLPRLETLVAIEAALTA